MFQNVFYPTKQKIASMIPVQKDNDKKTFKKLKSAIRKQGEIRYRDIGIFIEQRIFKLIEWIKHTFALNVRKRYMNTQNAFLILNKA